MPFFLPHKHAPKEMSESVGCLMAAMNIDAPLKDARVIVVGDGVKPRTGAVFALFTKAIVHSIDPLMRTALLGLRVEGGGLPNLDRLSCHTSKGQDMKINCAGERVLVVLPHSHCPMQDAAEIPYNYSRLDIINLPCCVAVPDNFLNIVSPPKVYKDPNILSGKNTMYVWEDWGRIRSPRNCS